MKNKNIIFTFLIILCGIIIYNQYITIKNKNEEIYLLENITEEFNVSLQNMDNEMNNEMNNTAFSNKILTQNQECPECPKCNEERWNSPNCKECPQFYNDRIIYKDLITKYKIEFPDYEMLHNREKDILQQIFGSDNFIPKPNIDREYFPYNVLDSKIDMNNVIPSMA